MQFGVLGPLVVHDDDGQEVTVPEAKVRALLAMLLAQDGGTVPADRLIDALWETRPPANPPGALQARVSQLRRVLGKTRVVHRPPGYHLDLRADEVDAARFRELTARAAAAPAPADRDALLTGALELWRGPAYADFADADFARPVADRLAEERLTALEERAAARLELGDHTSLVGELTELVSAHPLRERLRALHLRALYAAGRQSEALAGYEELRVRLAEELGVDPGPELTALHTALLRQDPRLAPPAGARAWPPPGAPNSSWTPPAGQVSPRTPSDPPTPTPAHPTAPGSPSPVADAPRSQPGSPSLTRSGDLPAPPGDLPTPLTALIGRDGTVAQVRQLLTSARLVTLTGPGGVGKTRLAIAAAAETPDSWLVELSGLRSGSVADLADVVATALGVRDDAGPTRTAAPTATATPGSKATRTPTSGSTPMPASTPPDSGSAPSPAQSLTAALRDRRALLVLDNCEHVVDAAAGLAARLLSAAPGLRVLTTSQEPLGLTGEAVVLVEPLAAPDAVRLFTERAAASAPGFSADPAAAGPAERAAVAEICRRLDGIPLALELAATRVRALGVQALAARLENRFQVLTSGRRDAPARQQTLRAVIDWSWELLSAPERIVLRRLAVFSDGCDLAAAEAVTAGDGVTGTEVLDLVTRLVDRSLVVVASGPAGPRYHLLESVAAYAVERMHEMADLTATRRRHLAYYLELAEHAEPGLRGPEQRHRLGQLDAEAGNLRAALDTAMRLAAAGDSAPAERLTGALTWWWLLRGRLTEARRALGAVLGHVSPAAPEPPTELLLLLRAFTLLTEGRGTEAARVPADGCAPGAPDPVRRARALWLCAYGLFSAGGAHDADTLNSTALRLFAAFDDTWGTAAALGLRARLALDRGDLAGLDRDGHHGARLFRELGDNWGELQTVPPLATLAEIKGAYEEAERLQRDGLRIARDLGLPAEVSARLSGLGRLALLARDWDRARALHRQARAIAAEQGYAYAEIHAEMGLALGARRSGDLAAAQDHLARLRDGFAQASSPAGEHLRLAELGFLAELRSRPDEAIALHLRGLTVARALDEPRALALSLEGLAGALTTRAPEAAAALLGAAEAERRGVDAPLPPAERGDVDRIAAALRTTLGPAAYRSAFDRGSRDGGEHTLRRWKDRLTPAPDPAAGQEPPRARS
ncbi:AfsR/SARP family transcriptional regulator [Streptomyces sp. NPDC049813]|uniref:AfsR/SARP family transcriptional regulator n=1 Tax=Streptomyces sp. NPDC049813 TaxID=3365597 RepID=UPI0037AB0453